MTFTKAVDTIAAKVRSRTLVQLETLAREVPILNTTDEQGIVGAALERVLVERYTTAREQWPTPNLCGVLAAGGELYRDRADRAQREAVTSLLEQRYPDTTDPIDTYTEESGLTYGQHCSAVYLAAQEATAR